MKTTKIGVIGAGFWAKFQIQAWKELPNVEIVAICDINIEKANDLASQLAIKNSYSSAGEMVASEQLNAVDIITSVETHFEMVKLAAEKGINCIVQKPMCNTLEEANTLLKICNLNNVQLHVHENFRWQTPIRKVKEIIDSEILGSVFKARVSFCSAFPVFDNQPALAELEQFILMDLGVHTLDVARFLFGDAKNLFALTHKVNPKIKGEDVANVMLEMKNGIHCFCEISYASILEKESFPQTLLLIEAEKGSISLTHDFKIKITTKDGTTEETIKPKMYPWVDPAYAVVQSSVVDCNANILAGLVNEKTPETTASDNLKTLELVFGSYESALHKKVLNLN